MSKSVEAWAVCNNSGYPQAWGVHYNEQCANNHAARLDVAHQTEREWEVRRVRITVIEEEEGNAHR